MLFYIIIFLATVVFVEGTTEIISKSELFSSFRDWVAFKNGFFGKLVRCGFCTSVWVAALPAVVFTYTLHTEWYHVPVYFLFFVVVFHRLSNYLHNINDKFLDKFYTNRKGLQ